jgi:hypothetical protein
LGLPSGLFPSGFPTKTLYAPFLSPQPSNSSLFDHLNNIWWRIQIIKLLIMWFPPFPCYLIPLRTNILLCTLFSNSLSLCSFLNMSNQVSHPYKTTSKIIVLYVSIFIFLDSKLKTKILHQMIESFPCIQSAFNFYLNIILIR